MGCWDETCAVTRLPIMGGEEVVMVLVRRAERRDWMDLPWVLELALEPATRDAAVLGRRVVRDVRRGAYDCYGGVEGAAYDRDQHEPIFVAAAVWDEVQRAYGPLVRDPLERHPGLAELPAAARARLGGGEPDWLRPLMALVAFARATRTDLSGGEAYRGCQHDALAPYDLLAAMTARQLARKSAAVCPVAPAALTPGARALLLRIGAACRGGAAWSAAQAPSHTFGGTLAAWRLLKRHGLLDSAGGGREARPSLTRAGAEMHRLLTRAARVRTLDP